MKKKLEIITLSLVFITGLFGCENKEKSVMPSLDLPKDLLDYGISVESVCTDVGFSFSANVPWQATLSENWITFMNLPYGYEGKNVIHLSIQENKSYTTRTGYITIMTSDNKLSETIAIQQKGIVTVPVSSITLNKTELSLFVGESTTLTAIVKPDNATDRNVTWASSDESVAKVENGVVVGISKGEATIIANAGGKVAECRVSIFPVKATGVKIVNAKNSMLIGETQTLTYRLIPDNSEISNLFWSSSNQDVLTIDENGTCTAVSEGVAIITIHNNDKTISDKVEITVNDPYMELGIAYKSKWGLECTVKNISVSVNGAKMTCSISYSIKNITTDRVLSECTFNCMKQSGASARQYGFYGSLYPNESRTRSYTFDTLSSDPFVELKFVNTFDNEIVYPEAPDLVWDLAKSY